MHPAYVDLIEVTWCTVVWCTGTERAEMAAVSRGTGHVSAVSTPLRWIFKNVLKKKRKKEEKKVTLVETHASAVSLLESGE